jgi:putative transposase
MSHTHAHCLFHCVWSTKGRANLIAPDYQDRLWAYLGGIARENGFAALAVGGTSDHVHVLVSLPATLPVAKAVQLLKAGSSKWLHETFPAMAPFTWQEGYGAFSIGVAHVEVTMRYIAHQGAHHRSQHFDDEYTGFLKRHGIAYDPRYVFG